MKAIKGNKETLHAECMRLIYRHCIEGDDSVKDRIKALDNRLTHRGRLIQVKNNTSSGKLN